jgi:hypothetical protein
MHRRIQETKQLATTKHMHACRDQWKKTMHRRIQETKQLATTKHMHACRDQWKKTMHRRIQETKQFMMNMTDNQLEMTTKRTIMENEQMSAEVAYQSRQTSALVGQNQVLDARVAELKRALALSRDTQEELAKRNTVYQSTIKQLVRFLKCLV